MRIDAHHHLWDLQAVHYPWLMAQGEVRFFGDPAPIQRDYLLPEFTADAAAHNISASVHIQVGAADGLAEAKWVDAMAQQAAEAGQWHMKQVAFCDLAADDCEGSLIFRLYHLLVYAKLLAPGEDALTGTQCYWNQRPFLGLSALTQRGCRLTSSFCQNYVTNGSCAC